MAANRRTKGMQRLRKELHHAKRMFYSNGVSNYEKHELKRNGMIEDFSMRTVGLTPKRRRSWKGWLKHNPVCNTGAVCNTCF
jgi:hypothetical protein